MEIPDPPNQRGCATCQAALSWLFSPYRQAWICVVPINAKVFALHECRHAQDVKTWRDLQLQPGPGQAGINAAGRERADAAIHRIEETP